MFSKIYEGFFRFLPILAILFIIFFFASDENEAYDEGYYQGSEDARHSFFEENEAYDEGYYQGSEDARHSFFEENVAAAVEDAVDYTRQNNPWHPEEAAYIIDVYTNPDKYPNEERPSQEEYLDAINSLCAFFDYFYCRHYEGYYD